MPSNEVIPSTGQTYADLQGLSELFALAGDNYQGKPNFTAPPALIDPNYVPPRRDTCGYLVGTLVALTLAAGLVIFRVISTQRSRINPRRIIYLEDWLLLTSVVMAYSLLAVGWTMVAKYQAGMHVYDVHLDSALALLKWGLVFEELSVWTYTFTRLSLLMTFRRLYSPFPTCMRRVIDCVCVTKICCGIITTFVLIYLDPHHPSASWDLFEMLKYDVHGLKNATAICAMAIVEDFIILVMPLPLLFKLKKLSLRKKVFIGIMFGFGFMTTAVSCVRLYEVIKTDYGDAYDFTWTITILLETGHIEIVVAIITASLPTANIIFGWAYPKLRRRSRISRKHYNNVDTLTSTCSTSYGTDRISDSLTKSDIIRLSQIPSTTSEPQSGMFSTSKSDDILGIGIKRPPMTIIKPVRPLVSREPSAQSIKSMKTVGKTTPEATATPVVTPEELDHVNLDDDEEHNFYEDMVPSDSFFPYATGLQPRPNPRVRSRQDLRLQV